MPVDLFNWAEMWRVAGPFLIMGIVAIIIGFVCARIMFVIPKGRLRELFSIVAVMAIVLGALGAVYIAAGVWGYGF